MASMQSAVIASREVLETQLANLKSTVQRALLQSDQTIGVDF